MRLICVLLAVFMAVGCARKQASVPPPAPAPVPVTPAPAQPQKPKSTVRKPVRTQPSPTTPPPETTPPAPAVTTMIPAEQRAEYRRQIAGDLSQAERNLATAKSRPMTEDQRQSAVRVESFIRQSRQAEAGHDLITARGLAGRARLLSEELLRH